MGSRMGGERGFMGKKLSGVADFFCETGGGKNDK
jgi:hypothetical protein